ncbi:hypothetical protein PY092_19285 [Muricauda sp. 334s03]|uniref:ROS/MUCR transcriptional regulator protein n=1 Tax=Flagellimonas yonaguniensis TaxID=3031325 RepID=A0ABT5Y4D8_9FLAO|nr:hypothetical protein [[Muricauda] yonaguniensis]MDF0718312.1 hypothetical protein [[Muricauda] yonaguniensis]
MNNYLEPKFNTKGQPICEICGLAYDKLLQHVSMGHGISAFDYKRRFNLNPRQGIQTAKLTTQARKRVKRNFKTVVLDNLIVKGRDTRFKKGNQHTDIEKVRMAMKKRWEAAKQQKIKTKADIVHDLISKLGR